MSHDIDIGIGEKWNDFAERVFFWSLSCCFCQFQSFPFEYDGYSQEYSTCMQYGGGLMVAPRKKCLLLSCHLPIKVIVVGMKLCIFS